MACSGGTAKTEVQCGKSSLLPRETVVKMTGTEEINLAAPSSSAMAAWPDQGLIVFSLLF